MNATLLVVIIGAVALFIFISFFLVQFNQMISSTNQRIDNLNAIIMEFSKNIGQIQEVAGSTNQRVDNLNNIIAELSRNMGQIQEVAGNTSQRIDNLNSIIAELSKNIGQIQEMAGSTNQRVDNLNNILLELSRNIGQIQEGARQMLDIGRSIAKLEDLFKGQQFRGRVGEMMLERLIEDLLPKSYYEFQFQLKNGVRVDAVIKFPNMDKVLPIDSKFPLSNYEKMLQEKDEKERKKYRDAFIRDIKKYINPHNGTLGFAFMFIPSESVYYEIIQDGEEILEYMLEKKVIPTSPTTLYFHLVIFMNQFKILEIQRNLDKLIGMLSGLEKEFKELQGEFETLGRHIANAQSKYNQIGVRFQKLSVLVESFTKGDLLNPKL